MGTSTKISKPLPQLRSAVWHSLDAKLNAYKLPDESFAFTFRQITNPVNQPSQSLSQFLEKTQNAEPVFSAYLPNGILANVCSLKTAIQYWKHLESTQPEKIQNKVRELRSAAEYYIKAQALSSEYVSSSTPNSRQSGLKVDDISYINLLDYADSSLQVLACVDSERETLYLIEVASFLKLIGVEPNWLARTSTPVLHELHTYGLSQEHMTCYLGNREKVSVFTLSDCLAVCEYLIKRGNYRAADFLIALALIPLEARCRNAFCQ